MSHLFNYDPTLKVKFQKNMYNPLELSMDGLAHLGKLCLTAEYIAKIYS